RGASSRHLGEVAETATPWALAETDPNAFPVAGPGTPVNVKRPTTIYTPKGPMDVEGGIDSYVHSWPDVMTGVVEQKYSDPGGKSPKKIFAKTSAITKNLIKNMEHAEKVFDAAEIGMDLTGSPIKGGAYKFPPNFREVHKKALEALKAKQSLPEGF